jgi:hypothetical protein
MIAATVAAIALLLWNAVYCTRKALADFRGPTPASGVAGLLAIVGAVLPMALLAFLLLLSHSGV